MKKMILALLFVVGLAGVAQANTYSLGTITSTPTYGVNHVNRGSFTDYLKFSVAAPYNSISAAVVDWSWCFSDIANIGLKLYNGAGNLIASSLGTNSTGWYMAGTLASGNYSLKVTGDASGRNAQYAYGAVATRVAAPVPEPGEWALMLSGLGLVGAVVRRRTKGRTE